MKIGQLLGAGPEFVGIMSNGTSGDINNIDFRGGQEKQPPYGRIQIVANDVAQARQLPRIRDRAAARFPNIEFVVDGLWHQHQHGLEPVANWIEECWPDWIEEAQDLWAQHTS